MTSLRSRIGSVALLAAGLATMAFAACGDDDETEADRRGVGAQCETNDDCPEEGQVCLTNFTGGYCGIANCTADIDCPSGSKCVTHEGANYCFRVCNDKPECNRHRDEAVEANCSSNVVFVEDEDGVKACVPPSSGI